jgi:hypothetical protein
MAGHSPAKTGVNALLPGYSRLYALQFLGVLLGMMPGMTN